MWPRVYNFPDFLFLICKGESWASPDDPGKSLLTLKVFSPGKQLISLTCGIEIRVKSIREKLVLKKEEHNRIIVP